MAIIFDGKAFAKTVEEKIKGQIEKSGNKIKMVTVCNPSDPANRIYANIKAKKAQELGIEFEQFDVRSTVDLEGLLMNLNKDNNINGLMLQLPLTGDKSRDIKLCQLIDPKKDADGLNPASGVIPATVRAVVEILGEAIKDSGLRIQDSITIAVVGGDGNVGRALARELMKNLQFKIYNLDVYNFSAEKIREADVVISATGQESLIKPDYIKEGAICIDVGYPHGDFDPTTALKAGFFTPVPGGVGPVTVAMLFQNLIELTGAV